LVGVTGVRSHWVCVTAGAILVLFGLIPKMSVVVASVPQFVLGGAGIVIFGMVMATGIKILAKVDPLLHSGILLATISAVALNAYFNGFKEAKKESGGEVTGQLGEGH